MDCVVVLACLCYYTPLFRGLLFLSLQSFQSSHRFSLTSFILGNKTVKPFSQFRMIRYQQFYTTGIVNICSTILIGAPKKVHSWDYVNCLMSLYQDNGSSLAVLTDGVSARNESKALKIHFMPLLQIPIHSFGVFDVPNLPIREVMHSSKSRCYNLLLNTFPQNIFMQLRFSYETAEHAEISVLIIIIFSGI